MSNQPEQVKALDRYLSSIDVLGMAFGIMVGWGLFAMPGNTFLPVAGPAGTLIALAIGMGIMLIIGRNFSYLMERCSITVGVRRIYGFLRKARASGGGQQHQYGDCEDDPRADGLCR